MKKIKVSLKFYTVIIDGEEYWTTGKSRRQVATDNGVKLEDVTIGAATMSLQHVNDRNA